MTQEIAQPLLSAGKSINTLDLILYGLRHLSPDRKNALGNELAQRFRQSQGCSALGRL
jgi:hypothetical protein